MISPAFKPWKIIQVRLIATVTTYLLISNELFAGIQIKVGHYPAQFQSPNFVFTNVPQPSRNDAGSKARFIILSGEPDANSGHLKKLNDGKLPAKADAPAENFFFAAGSLGGWVEVDLGRSIKIKQVNTYSWHPSTRGPQVYKLYASKNAAAGFDARRGKGVNVVKCGWKLVANVDTRNDGNDGGQYGVNISNPHGIIGKYRYLLFDISPTETNDPFGNTFYSEIDVVELNSPVETIPTSIIAPLILRSADDYAEITIDTAESPELREWAEHKLAPALVEWYPKIVLMLPSDGFSAPKKFSVIIRPGNGVAYTSDAHIVVNSTWLAGELNNEAVGSIIHETVHVIQQYGNGRGDGSLTPGWFTEGLSDYIRFFKYQPQAHGADIVWLEQHCPRNLRYDEGYRVSANFLDYVVEHYDLNKNLIQKVNAACRDGSYTEALWNKLTGKPLTELNNEWKTVVQQHLRDVGGSAASK